MMHDDIMQACDHLLAIVTAHGMCPAVQIMAKDAAAVEEHAYSFFRLSCTHRGNYALMRSGVVSSAAALCGAVAAGPRPGLVAGPNASPAFKLDGPTHPSMIACATTLISAQPCSLLAVALRCLSGLFLGWPSVA